MSRVNEREREIDWHLVLLTLVGHSSDNPFGTLFVPTFILFNIFFTFHYIGWIDDHMKDDVWKNLNAQPHAFTTGRPRPNQNTTFSSKKIPTRPKGSSQTLKQPGKLNLKSFAIVNEALARMNLGDNKNYPVVDKKFTFQAGTKSDNSKSRNARKMAAPEEDEGNEHAGGDHDQEYEEAEYEQITNDGFSDAVNNIASQFFTFNSQDSASRNKLRHRREKEQQSKSCSSSS